MNHEEFKKIVTETVEGIHRLVEVKGGEYSHDHDRLSNFYEAAATCGTTPLQSALDKAHKHWDAVARFVRQNAEGKTIIRSEPIQQRMDDLIVYMILMKAILADQGTPSISNLLVEGALNPRELTPNNLRRPVK